MKTYWQNLSACLICSLFLSSPAIGGKTKKNQKKDATNAIVKDLENHKGGDFTDLLESWQKKFGDSAIKSLTKISKNQKVEDTQRYIAIMGLSKLAGGATSSIVAPLLTDSSWLVKIGALRALRLVSQIKQTKLNSEQEQAVAKMMNDPALVGRNEAVITIMTLGLRSATPELINALKDQKNYHKGKAQWVPQKALSTLLVFEPNPATARKIASLLQRKTDQDLLKQTVSTIEKMMGQKSPKGSLNVQADFWTKKLL